MQQRLLVVCVCEFPFVTVSFFEILFLKESIEFRDI